MSLFTTTLFIGGSVRDIRTQRTAPAGRYTLSGYLCIVFEGTGLTYRWATVGGLTSFDVIVEGRLAGVPPLSALCQPDDDWLKDTPQDIHPPVWE